MLDDFEFLGQIELKTIFSYIALQQCLLDCTLVWRVYVAIILYILSCKLLQMTSWNLILQILKDKYRAFSRLNDFYKRFDVFVRKFTALLHGKAKLASEINELYITETLKNISYKEHYHHSIPDNVMKDKRNILRRIKSCKLRIWAFNNKTTI